MGWKPSDRIAVAVFNFDAQNEQQLSLHVGDLLYLLEEAPGWYRGYLYYEPMRKGVFPASFVQVKDHTTAKTGDKAVVVPADDMVALEATQCLREWRDMLKELFKTGPREKYRQLLHFMEDVLAWRRNLLHSSATQDALQDMRTRLTARIDMVNSKFGCPQTPRDQRGLTVNCSAVSMQELFRLHKDRQAEIEQQVPQTGVLEKKLPSTPTSQVHHLYVKIDCVDHQFPEDCELFFFLFDLARGRQITERFAVAWEKRRAKSTFHEQKSLSAVFTDLGTKDMQATGMYLVCQIVRKGKMLVDDRKHVSHHRFRRPYAIGVVEVTSILQVKDNQDWMHNEECRSSLTMPLYVCSANHESDFSTFHTNIIRKTGAKGGQKPGCAITLSLGAFHVDMQQLKVDFPSLFTKATVVVRKLGFPDVILPGDVRNDVYITMESGQFEKGSKRAERNVEVAVSVIDKDARPIPRAIVLGAGLTPVEEYESFVYYHDNTPKWNETFKLSIPFEKVPDAHLRITFRHVAKNEPKDKADKTFAFAYMKIMKEDGSIIQDGSQQLYVYKADGKRGWSDPRVYLRHPSCKEDVPHQTLRNIAGPKGLADGVNLQLSRSFKETLHLSTLTCSTKLTQKIELLKLLKWRQKERDLSVVLTNLTKIDGEEMVKFLQDTLDCLFDILNSNSEKYGELVFDALVSVFGLLSDDRYQHFTTVLDIYIAKHFSAVLAYRCLLRCFSKSVDGLGGAPDSRGVSRVLKSMQYIFRFMVQSHTLYIRHNNREDPAFKGDVHRAIGSLSAIMGLQESQAKGIHCVQSLLLQKMPLVLNEVVQIFSHYELAKIVAHFLDSIRNTHETVPGDKLIFILSVLNGSLNLLSSSAARNCIVPTLVGHLMSHMEHLMPRTNFSPQHQANEDCITCVAKLLEQLSDRKLMVTAGDVDMVLPLLPLLLRMCKQIPRTNSLAPLNIINFVGLLDIMHDEHYATHFMSLKSADVNTLKSFVVDLMSVLENVIRAPSYPKDWVTMFFLQNRVIARALLNTSKTLIDGFLNNTDFTPQIWDTFFALCTLFITQPCLQLEKFSELRKLQYVQQFGDMRLTVGKHVVVLWHKLGDKKGNFIPNLIGPFLEMSLVRQRDLRTVTLPLIVDIMKCEQIASDNFKRVETEIFDKMDTLVSSQGWGDEEYKELFHELLKRQCEATTVLQKAGPPFIDSVSRLIALLLDYGSVSGDAHKAQRMGCMLNLLNFYREIDKEELYVRYIYKLAELHIGDQSYTEAGFTLLLHARALEWCGERVEAVGEYPQQTARLRKERLYLDCIRLFDQGKSWESGIPLCKELAQLYETEVFEYQKLADILMREAEFFQKIIREIRVESEYFMVGYYGKGFPLLLRNKVFIHRGKPFERLGSFMNRITDEFTTAKILKTSGVSPPDSDTQNSPGMHLMIRSVQPVPDDKMVFKGKRVPEKISGYYKTNEVRAFQYDRPFHKGEKNRECEFATLWIERTRFSTSQSFPGVISWFEVERTESVELNPLDIALETVGSKNREIQTLSSQYSADRSLNINPLSMLLNGVIDAAVMGGITNYEKIFFNDAYRSEHPDHEDGVKKLRALIEEQANLLERALSLHGQLIKPSLQGLHDKLEGCFLEFQLMVFPDRRKASEIQVRAKAKTTTLARPLPPTPFEFSSPNRRASGLQTLPGVIRRATGIPGKLKHSLSSADELEEVVVRRPPKRSATTLGKQKTLSQSPPVNRKRLSHSSSSENLSVREGSVASSRQSSSGSVNRLAEEDEDDGGIDVYERVDDFLGPPGSRGSLSSLRDSVYSVAGPMEPDVRSSRPAPSYPAPAPPPDEGMEVDHDYEPVVILPHQEEQRGEEGRAALPLVVAVGGGGHGLSPVKSNSSSPSRSQPMPRTPPKRSPPPEDNRPTLPVKLHKLRPEAEPAPKAPPPGPVVADEDVYVFDQLEDVPAVHKDSPKVPPKRRQQPQGLEPQGQHPPHEPTNEVYFDHLFGSQEAGDQAGTQAYFDHLFTGPEAAPAAAVGTQATHPPQPSPYTSHTSQSPPEDRGDDVPPPVPVKRSKTVKNIRRDVYETPQIHTRSSRSPEPKPVPRPRNSTIIRRASEGPVPRTPPPLDLSDTAAPVLPPKPPTPSVPPRPAKPPPPREAPSGGGDQPPPLPEKPANWKRLSVSKR